MNSKVFMVLRIFLGIFVLVFGLNKFLNFIPMSEMSPQGGAYFGALVSSNTITLVAIVEILAGLALIFNKFGALFALILMSVSVNALLFHVSLEPASMGGAVMLFVLNVIVLFSYKNAYKYLIAG